MLKCHKRKPLALPPASADGRERYLPFLQITFILSQMRGRRTANGRAVLLLGGRAWRIALSDSYRDYRYSLRFDRVPRLRCASASRVWRNAKRFPFGNRAESRKNRLHVDSRSRRFRFALTQSAPWSLNEGPSGPQQRDSSKFPRRGAPGFVRLPWRISQVGQSSERPGPTVKLMRELSRNSCCAEVLTIEWIAKLRPGRVH